LCPVSVLLCDICVLVVYHVLSFNGNLFSLDTLETESSHLIFSSHLISNKIDLMYLLSDLNEIRERDTEIILSIYR
jgi:hypothetical protein